MSAESQTERSESVVTKLPSPTASKPPPFSPVAAAAKDDAISTAVVEDVEAAGSEYRNGFDRPLNGDNESLQTSDPLPATDQTAAEVRTDDGVSELLDHQVKLAALSTDGATEHTVLSPSVQASSAAGDTGVIPQIGEESTPAEMAEMTNRKDADTGEASQVSAQLIEAASEPISHDQVVPDMAVNGTSPITDDRTTSLYASADEGHFQANLSDPKRETDDHREEELLNLDTEEQLLEFEPDTAADEPAAVLKSEAASQDTIDTRVVGEPDAPIAMEKVETVASSPVVEGKISEPVSPVRDDIVEKPVSLEPESVEPEPVEPVAVKPVTPTLDDKVAKPVSLEPESIVSVEQDSIEPDSVKPDSVEPVVVKPVTPTLDDKVAKPVSLEPEKMVSVEPDSIEPDSVEPVAVKPDSVEPVAVEPVAVKPDSVEQVAVKPVTPVHDDKLTEPVYVKPEKIVSKEPDSELVSEPLPAKTVSKPVAKLPSDEELLKKSEDQADFDVVCPPGDIQPDHSQDVVEETKPLATIEDEDQQDQPSESVEESKPEEEEWMDVLGNGALTKKVRYFYFLNGLYSREENVHL